MKYLFTALALGVTLSSQAQKSCNCNGLDIFPEAKPLLTSTVSGKKITVCGYEDSQEIKANLFYKDQKSDKTVYVNGFGIYNCTDKNSIFVAEGEIDNNIIKVYPGYIEVTRLVDMPVGKNFEFKSLPVISYKIKLMGNTSKIDTSFVLPTKIFTQQFLASLKKKADQMKRQSKSDDYLDYLDYLTSYNFINAVLNPAKYAEEFKNMEGLDGAYAEVHGTLLDYYDIFENQHHK